MQVCTAKKENTPNFFRFQEMIEIIKIIVVNTLFRFEMHSLMLAKRNFC